jgi:hypothetical protein
MYIIKPIQYFEDNYENKNVYKNKIYIDNIKYVYLLFRFVLFLIINFKFK